MSGCSGILAFAHDFQGLITGLCAIVAAFFTVAAIVYSTRAPISAERRRIREIQEKRLRVGSYELAEALRLVSKRARQGKGTIKVFKASPNSAIDDKVREQMNIPTPALINDWEYMALLPEGATIRLVSLKSKLLDHAFDISRAGGAFGSDNFGESLLKRLDIIEAEAAALISEITKIAAGIG